MNKYPKFIRDHSVEIHKKDIKKVRLTQDFNLEAVYMADDFKWTGQILEIKGDYYLIYIY